MTAARREPAASITARTSSIRVSSVGAPPTRSDMPVPRLSNRISRPYDGEAAVVGSAKLRDRPLELDVRDEAGDEDEVDGPSPTTW